MADQKYYLLPNIISISDADRWLIYDAESGQSRNITIGLLKAIFAVADHTHPATAPVLNNPATGINYSLTVTIDSDSGQPTLAITEI